MNMIMNINMNMIMNINMNMIYKDNICLHRYKRIEIKYHHTYIFN